MFKIKKTSAALPYYIQFAVVNAVNILINIKPVDPILPSKRNEGAAVVLQLPAACLGAIRTREPTLMFEPEEGKEREEKSTGGFSSPRFDILC